MDVLAGIDLSLTSTGLVVYTPSENTINMFFYATRQKDKNRTRNLICKLNDIETKVIIQPFSRQIAKRDVIEKYHIIVEDVLEVIVKYNCFKIRMEGYAFDAKSSSLSKLHELGGILKYSFYKRGIKWEEIPPTRLKKWFTGSGKASKELMYEHFIHKGLPPLLNIFEMEKCKGVPNPVQDMVDAFALVHSFLIPK